MEVSLRIFLVLAFVLYLAGFMFGLLQFEAVSKTVVPNTLEAPDFWRIVVNNIRVLALLLLGALLFGSTTFVNLIFNGVNLGVVVKASISKTPMTTLMLILPHGILEIPAIIIAGAAGFKIPYEFVRYLLGRKEVVLTKEDIKEYLTLALISIILIVIAAWIEANVTLKIAKAMLNSTKSI